MPSQESDWLFQPAVLWAATDFDSDGRQKVTSTPVQIYVKFNQGKSRQASATNDNKQLAGEAVVDRQIAVGSLVRIGKLEELPTPLTELMVVVGYNEVSDIKQQERFRSVTLNRYQGQPLT